MSCALARAEGPTLLIVSQPNATTKPKEFVDISYYLARSLRETGKYEVIAFKPALPAVRAALDAKKLTPADINEPLSKESIHKVAQALGANYALRVCAHLAAKDALGVEAEMESLTGQNLWSHVFVAQLDPYRQKGKKPNALEAVLAQVSTLVERITGAPTQPLLSGNTVEVGPGSKKPTKERPGKEKPPEVKNENPTPPPPDPGAGAERSPSDPPRDPKAPSANEILVARFRQQGDLTNLIVSLRRAINDKPRDIGLRRELIKAYSDRGWNDAARDEALRAIALAPADAGLHRLLGDSYMAAGDSDTALKEYREAVRLDGKDGGGLVALGDAYWNLAKPDEARKAYVDAAQADPKNPLPHRRLARLHAQRGQYADGLTAMTQARNLTPPDDAASLRADYVALLGIVEADLTDMLAKMQAGRKSFLGGGRTREEVFKEISALKRRAEEAGAFLDQLPADAAFVRVQALYAQAVSLVAQAGESTLLFLETKDDRRDEEATLLRLEAGKQIADAAKRLKALVAQKKVPPD